MTEIEFEPEAYRAQLVALYRRQPPLEQQMLQLLSVIYEPVGREAMMACCNLAGLRDGARQFNAKTIRPLVDRLLALELIVRTDLGVVCQPLLVEIATRDALQAGRLELFARVVQEKLPVRSGWNQGIRYFSSRHQLMREVRLGVYRQDVPFIHKQLEAYQTYRNERVSLVEMLVQICNNPFDPGWFRTLCPELFYAALASIFTESLLDLIPAGAQFALLEEICTQVEGDCSDAVRALYVEQLLLRGRPTEAGEQLARISAQGQAEAAPLLAWLALVVGDPRRAIAGFTAALKEMRRATGKRQVFFGGAPGLLFVLALIKEGSAERLREAENYAAMMARHNQFWMEPAYTLLKGLLAVRRGELAAKDALIESARTAVDSGHSLEALVASLCLYWLDPDGTAEILPHWLELLHNLAGAAGYRWLCLEAAHLLARLDPEGPWTARAEALTRQTGIATLVDAIEPLRAWELALNALSAFEAPARGPGRTSQRLAWFVEWLGESRCRLIPREQKLTASGAWTKGRNVSLKKLRFETEAYPYLSEQDLRLCQHITGIAESSYYSSQVHYEFDERAIVALVGHPLVFWEDAPTTRIEVVQGEAELLVRQGKGGRLVLEFSPELSDGRDVKVVKETPTRLKVIELGAEQRRVAEILGRRNRLEVPAQARERVLAAINAVSRLVTVHSDIGGGAESAETVPADSRPHFHLLPAGEGLKVALLARPFGGGGPYYRPGRGGETVIAELEGKRLQTVRDLAEEQRRAAAAISACPTLTRLSETDGEWLVEDPQDCLELLLELQSLGDGAVIEWPEGQKFRISHQAGLERLQVNVQSERDWFALSGELRLDEGLAVDMQQLLALVEKSPGRFVALADGQFLALTEEFRKRLDALRTYTEKHGQTLRFHGLAAPALEEVLDGVGSLTCDPHWQEQIARLRQLEQFEPAVPSTLQADLRDYQCEGFRWLARLAHWGAGACLADDMGLGKTVQSLALVLARATDGPTLVVAPTSVCNNWADEARRFAPTLRIVSLATGDRRRTIESLQPFDLVLCSYGLLQQEEVAGLLAGVTWQTVILDEAQAIKNMSTRRSQAAMNLRSGFKLITTGTPIENHLGELWNLFRFINPGLLGSLDSFNRRFATPIERNNDRQARTRLRRLIQPFLLRRTKGEVLAELPARTEILLQVELSEEETAFYEALRRRAIERIESDDADPLQKRFRVLAEIMKLRRACCNPRLVAPELGLASAKLQLFGEVLEELLANRHKALVFSQFVDHLQILRSHLDERQIRYQYLDGSTPAPERKKRVDAFQAGDGDVFLISLKAGGTGLNLTAADYVIHMDPWWNPAVEDQASDRAHRIGQQRPVTIYRLVAKHTIEEKIVDLHRHKRDLADSLLAGADGGGRLSTEELIQLLSEGV